MQNTESYAQQSLNIQLSNTKTLNKKLHEMIPRTKNQKQTSHDLQSQYFEDQTKKIPFDENGHLAVTTFRAELTIKKHLNVQTNCLIEN